MSPQLTSRSADLKRLRDEGYAIEVRSGLLLMHHVPYVDRQRKVRYGVLVSQLSLAGDVTVTPGTHVAMFSGAEPCDHLGQPLDALINDRTRQTPGAGVEIDFTFSSKPAAGYRDYHEKMTTYATILSSPAQALDPTATALTFPLIDADAEDSVFCYEDTATSRAGIGATAERLQGLSIAIVGLGGTGSYILDLVAKSPVEEIHLYDGDTFLQHNAFRSPGAASREDLEQAPYKADHFAALYSRMRRGITPHPFYVDESNAEALRTADFVFLALDSNSARRLITEKLEDYQVSFIDVGMGVYEAQGQLSGLVRVTASTPAQRRHVHDHQRVPLAEGEMPNEYQNNIQIADLNALNATLAVIKWKKLCGFYLDLEQEFHSIYQIDGNILTNEDTP
ncbi:ThiF family adenylyltransferase [Streptomyces sp. ISL-99]|uniref:ThiF family adenylyltransferase n=1 Tax=Streptomyces sp. ISL-99 TaxID=2819193 RepID=UPI001BE52E7C|nr:ThiF family adenylyltransferase [Streptomyces sp. ISL-99]MBT2530428.1 ThiF family adenylyltransferase [Streptomyces sp. ISL-99]